MRPATLSDVLRRRHLLGAPRRGLPPKGAEAAIESQPTPAREEAP